MTTVRGAIDYQTDFAVLRAQAAGDRRSQFASAGVDGALVLAGSVFATARVETGFAVVDAGVAGVPILFENRPAGKTNSKGRLLLTEVRPFQVNRLSVDVDALPANILMPRSVHSFRPNSFAGVRVPIDLARGDESALLHLVDERGRDLPVGSILRLDGGAATVTGFDGLASITKWRKASKIEVRTTTGTCHIDLKLPSVVPLGTIVGPLICRLERT